MPELSSHLFETFSLLMRSSLTPQIVLVSPNLVVHPLSSWRGGTFRLFFSARLIDKSEMNPGNLFPTMLIVVEVHESGRLQALPPKLFSCRRILSFTPSPVGEGDFHVVFFSSINR